MSARRLSVTPETRPSLRTIARGVRAVVTLHSYGDISKATAQWFAHQGIAMGVEVLQSPPDDGAAEDGGER